MGFSGKDARSRSHVVGERAVNFVCGLNRRRLGSLVVLGVFWLCLPECFCRLDKS